jgi:serine/threonine protein kinase
VERVAAPGPVHGAVCPSCGVAADQARCESCGAARHAGGYRIVRQIAQGPHGRVYEAEDDAGRRVALKELVFALVPTVQELEAFEREARLLSQLSHPRIPRFVRSFTEGSGPGLRLYLAQELVVGESLATVAARGPLPLPAALQVGAAVLDVLAYLHGRSPTVLHRDLKPANLLRGPDGEIRVVDFGVARELAGDRTHNATLVGTAGYMPPEQLGGTVDARSDLYALGATLAHLVSGRPPEARADAPLELELSALPVDGATRRFFARLTAAKPAARFASAEEAARALAALRTPAPRRVWPIAVGVLLALAAVAVTTQVFTPGPGAGPGPDPGPVPPPSGDYRKPISAEPQQR